MHFLARVTYCIITVSALLLAPISAPAFAAAELILEVELRGAYEDNVIGILSDQQKTTSTTGSTRAGASFAAAGKQGYGGSGSTSPYLGTSTSSTQQSGDYSFSALADLGMSASMTRDTAFFIIGSIENTTYSRYSDFDSTITGVSAGFVATAGPLLFVKTGAFGRLKFFGDSERDSSAFGGALELKQRFFTWLELKEAYEYENNQADSAFFSYTGHAARAGIGLQLYEGWLLNLGYTYLIRKYKEPADFEIASHLVSAGIRKTFFKNWNLTLGYAREMSSENLDNTRAANNIYTLGLLFSY